MGFWALGDECSEVPAVKLGKRKRFHKWGVLALLTKNKMMNKSRDPESELTWSTMAWRPLVSAYDNVWKRWYSLAGRTLTLLARLAWPKGDMVTSTREVQDKVHFINYKCGGRRGIR